MNYKLFSMGYCFLALSSFVYSSSGFLSKTKKDIVSDVSSEDLPNNRRVTFLEIDNVVDNTILSIQNNNNNNNNNNDDFIYDGVRELFYEQGLQNCNNGIAVSPREISIQTSTENKSPETLIQSLQQKIQELEEKLEIKESALAKQGEIIESKEKQMSTMEADHIKKKQEVMSKIQQEYNDNTKQMMSRLGEDHRRNMIVVATVSALSTLVVQKVFSIANSFVSSTKGSSESKS